MTQLLNGHSLQVEDLQKEHAAKVRELKEQQAEVAARAAALKDQLDGVYARGGGGGEMWVAATSAALKDQLHGAHGWGLQGEREQQAVADDCVVLQDRLSCVCGG